MKRKCAVSSLTQGSRHPYYDTISLCFSGPLSLPASQWWLSSWPYHLLTPCLACCCPTESYRQVPRLGHPQAGSPGCWPAGPESPASPLLTVAVTELLVPADTVIWFVASDD